MISPTHNLLSEEKRILMSRCFVRIGLGALLLSTFIACTAHAEAREVLSLDGVWHFATDPDNRGETEKWYQPDARLPAMPLPGYAPRANGKIRVPGIWDNQGYGTETDKIQHNYVGKGWYKRRVMIPRAWVGRRAFLVITGVHRYSKVWIDDHFLGEHIGYLSDQQYDVTPFATPGKTVTITIQVDSRRRWDVDTLSGASSLIDYVDVDWGGIWGHVVLEARPDTWLNDLYIQSDVPNSTCLASATLNGIADLPEAAKLEIFDKSGQRVAEAAVKLDSVITTGQSVSVKATLPNATLWTPDSPTLYTARLSLLKGSQILDTVESRFGMRQFTIDGYHLLLNGKRIMLRGYGDDHVYPEHMSMPLGKELHLQRLRIIKSYGFNHVRHHSTIMPPEYYDACDELGMITTAEFPIAYAKFLPGGAHWKKNVKPGTDPKLAVDTYHREWAAAITRHRNHPSIFCWVMGNEMWNGVPLRYDFQRIASERDPKRFFADSDGLLKVVDRDTLDVLFLMFNVWSSVFDNPNKFQTHQPPKPVISHETGNYVTFSRPDLVDEFKHNFKPFWLSTSKAKLEKLGLLQEASQWADKSERLYAHLHKYNLETLRKNPCLSGYHWWLFQDYWTTSNGIVDQYFRPKSITPEEVLKFNSPVVLLQDGLQRTYRGKDRLNLKLLVSNFSPSFIEGCLSYEVKAGQQSLVRKYLTGKAVTQGELSVKTAIELELPDVQKPVPLKITATLVSGKNRFANDWTARLYPAKIKPEKLSVPVFADSKKCKRFSAWGVKPIPLNGELPTRAVYLTGCLDTRTLDAINGGACVIMFDGPGQCRGKNLVGALMKCTCVVMLDNAGQLLKPRPVTFRTSWWKAGDNREENNTGTFVYDHPVTRAMAPDGWCDDGWFHLIEGGCKFDLEAAPARPEVLVRALSSLMLPADEALLFEVGVGKGSLIVSGLNHHHAEGRPENEWLIARLLDHAATFPQLKAKWPASFLTVASVATDGYLPGFRRLVTNEGEDGTWYSFRIRPAKHVWAESVRRLW